MRLFWKVLSAGREKGWDDRARWEAEGCFREQERRRKAFLSGWRSLGQRPEPRGRAPEVGGEGHGQCWALGVPCLNWPPRQPCAGVSGTPPSTSFYANLSGSNSATPPFQLLEGSWGCWNEPPHSPPESLNSRNLSAHKAGGWRTHIKVQGLFLLGALREVNPVLPTPPLPCPELLVD